MITSGRSIDYGELDALSNRIANWLRDRGTAPEQLIGVVMHKGWEQVAGALGILKAGAAYVPIDAAVPAERLRMLCRTSGITLALTQPGGPAAESWPEGVDRLVIDDETLAALSDAPPPPSSADPGDLAYVIFTSGSTGVPKGVMIEHRAAGNTIADVNDRFAVTDRDRVLSLSAFNFDLSVYDVFGMLSAGGAIVLPEPDAKQQPSRWADLVREHGVTIWNSVPALMDLFAQHLALPMGAAAGLAPGRDDEWRLDPGDPAGSNPARAARRGGVELGRRDRGVDLVHLVPIDGSTRDGRVSRTACRCAISSSTCSTNRCARVRSGSPASFTSAATVWPADTTATSRRRVPRSSGIRPPVSGFTGPATWVGTGRTA